MIEIEIETLRTFKSVLRKYALVLCDTSVIIFNLRQNFSQFVILYDLLQFLFYTKY